MSEGFMPPGYSCFLLPCMFMTTITVNNETTLKYWSRGYEDPQIDSHLPSISATKIKIFEEWHEQ